MNDRSMNLLEQYDIELIRTRKGRGAILCDTADGCLIWKEYSGNKEKLQLQDKLLKHIAACGNVKAEQLVPTKEGELVATDNDGVQYILKTYCEGRECNIYDKTECMDAVRVLARLHETMELLEEPPKSFSQAGEYEKRNRELKRVRRFLQQRSQKTWFEIQLLQVFDYFWEQALRVKEEWEGYKQKGMAETHSYCHGDYQYHNILRTEKEWFVMNFERCCPDSPMRDLYHLLRKLLEKSGWSVSLGRELLAAYEKERKLSAINTIDLYYRLYYPEKFWKIASFYFNSGKAWIPERNLEKLEKVMEQEKAKQQFLEEIFRKV